MENTLWVRHLRVEIWGGDFFERRRINNLSKREGIF
jgi:hypothetical protein